MKLGLNTDTPKNSGQVDPALETDGYSGHIEAADAIIDASSRTAFGRHDIISWSKPDDIRAHNNRFHFIFIRK